jgi:hypothetical protein
MKTLNQKLGNTKEEPTTAKHFNNIDKMKILENFVENDEVLGQLLDFISQRNGSATQNESSSKVIDPDVSMTMIDKQGNKIIHFKPQQQ